MTESDWWSCQEPQKMLLALRASGKLSERKGRLFAVAACRRLWHLLTDERSRQGVEVAEQCADGLADPQALRGAYQTAWAAAKELMTSSCPAAALDVADDADLMYGMRDEGLAAPASCAAAYAPSPDPADCDRVAYYAAHAQYQAASLLPLWDDIARRDAARRAELLAQAALLRDIFGPLPFRPVTLHPSARTWNDGCIVQLATSIYDGRDFSPVRMGVLADALEEAGVSDAEVLGHCRDRQAVHVRGCWLIDLLLLKE
jgi:hypothetical protein